METYCTRLKNKSQATEFTRAHVVLLLPHGATPGCASKQHTKMVDSRNKLCIAFAFEWDLKLLKMVIRTATELALADPSIVFRDVVEESPVRSCGGVTL